MHNKMRETRARTPRLPQKKNKFIYRLKAYALKVNGNI